MIEKYLRKLQELQLRTVGTPVCMQVQTRWDKEGGEPWLTILVYHEDWLESDGERDDLCLSTQMHERKDDTLREVEIHMSLRYDTVKEFVEKLLSI